MKGVVLVCLLLFGFGSCLPDASKNNSTNVLTRKVESTEPEFSGQFEELVEKVDVIKEMLDKIYNSGLDDKVVKTSETVDKIYNSGDDKLDKIMEKLDKLSNASEKTYTSCASLLKAGFESGVYKITPVGLAPMKAYCDMTTDGGGWTVIQRRTSEEVDFYRNWTDYRHFFGDVEENYWLGLEPIHRLTKYENFELYVKLQDFDSDWYYAKYSHFDVESEMFKYRLNVKGFTGTAGDSLAYSNGEPFSTKDRDNDGYNCPVQCQGAWWYLNCAYSNLNGLYNNYKTTGVTTNFWYHTKSRHESLKSTIMMIRPADFKP